MKLPGLNIGGSTPLILPATYASPTSSKVPDPSTADCGLSATFRGGTRPVKFIGLSASSLPSELGIWNEFGSLQAVDMYWRLDNGFVPYGLTENNQDLWANYPGPYPGIYPNRDHYPYPTSWDPTLPLLPLFGCVVHFHVQNSGSGYYVLPPGPPIGPTDVYFTGGSGSGASGYVNSVDWPAGGGVTSIGTTRGLAAEGSGYTVGNVLTIPGGNGDATIQVLSVDGTTGAITSTTILAAGTGYKVLVDASGGIWFYPPAYVNFTGGSGLGACGFVGGVILGAVTSVTLTQSKTGYVVNDVLTVPGGDGACRIKVTNVDGSGHITAYSITARGATYTASSVTYPPANQVAAISGGSGSGATGFVDAVVPIGTRVSLTGGHGSGAIAYVSNTDGSGGTSGGITYGAITGLTFTSLGTGYQAGDVLSVPGGTSGQITVGSVYAANGAIVCVSGGGLTAYSITAGGSGYGTPTSPSLTLNIVSLTGGSGAGAQGYVTTVGYGGVITGFIVTNNGSGYVNGDVLGIPGGNGDGTLTWGAFLQPTGTGYTSPTGGVGQGDFTIVLPGQSYQVGNVLTIPGGNGDATLVVDDLDWYLYPTWEITAKVWPHNGSGLPGWTLPGGGGAPTPDTRVITVTLTLNAWNRSSGLSSLIYTATWGSTSSLTRPWPDVMDMDGLSLPLVAELNGCAAGPLYIPPYLTIPNPNALDYYPLSSVGSTISFARIPKPANPYH